MFWCFYYSAESIMRLVSICRICVSIDLFFFTNWAANIAYGVVDLLVAGLNPHVEKHTSNIFIKTLHSLVHFENYSFLYTVIHVVTIVFLFLFFPISAHSFHRYRHSFEPAGNPLVRQSSNLWNNHKNNNICH